MMRSMIRKNFISGGFTNIDLAINGKEAMSMLQNKQYELVTLDVSMPVMDGFGFLEVLRQFDEFKNVMVMMVTAEADRGLILRLIELGANEFIVKPFSSGTFTRKICFMMEHRERSKEEILADLDAEKEEQESLLSNIKDHRHNKSWEEDYETMVNFCPQCGTKVRKESNFCHKCGFSLVFKS